MTKQFIEGPYFVDDEIPPSFNGVFARVGGIPVSSPNWLPDSDKELLRPTARLFAAAPALYHALKDTNCRYSRSGECGPAAPCDRCAAIQMVEADLK